MFSYNANHNVVAPRHHSLDAGMKASQRLKLSPIPTTNVPTVPLRRTRAAEITQERTAVDPDIADEVPGTVSLI